MRGNRLDKECGGCCLRYFDYPPPTTIEVVAQNRSPCVLLEGGSTRSGERRTAAGDNHEG